jgi:hypothetical protein
MTVYSFNSVSTGKLYAFFWNVTEKCVENCGTNTYAMKMDNWCNSDCGTWWKGNMDEGEGRKLFENPEKN